MRSTRLLPLALLALAAACADQSSTPTSPIAIGQLQSPRRMMDQDYVEVMDLNPHRDASGPGINAGPMIYHGGPIVPATKVAAIYWAKNRIYTGGPTPGTTGTGATDGSLIGHFLRNVGGSPYFNINTTYFDNFNTVGNSVTYTQWWADNTSVPPTTGATVSNTTIKNEIIKGFNNGKLTYDSMTIYVVFTAGKTNLGGGFGTQYCAYHGAFNWNGKRILYAAQPYNFAFKNGCSAGTVSPNNDAPADYEINTLAHEIEEAATDPRLNAWFDVNGQENADKCAWTFGTTYTTGNGGTANMNLGGKDFLIQQNWVNISGGGNCALSF